MTGPAARYIARDIAVGLRWVVRHALLPAAVVAWLLAHGGPTTLILK